MSQDTAAVRSGEELDRAALTGYLQDKIEGGASLAIEQFPGGHSNLTYLLRTPAREFVLRRGPLGPVAPKAHDMAREYMVLKAVHPFFDAAPEVFHLCEDTSIIGAVFFIMERRRGIVMRDRIPPELAAFPDYPARVSRGFVDCLVELHAVDIQEHGLVSLGKPAGFLERQVRGWFERWNRAKTEEIALMERLIQWLTDHLPASPEPTLVHNDFKLDNLMLASDDIGRVEAVLDWEMTTVGDPLADVGLSLCYWTSGIAGGPDLAVPGWYTRDEFVHEYATRTGRDVSAVGWYEVLGIFKLAVILQQIYFRWKIGQTKDQRFAALGGQVRELVQRAQAQTPARY